KKLDELEPKLKELEDLIALRDSMTLETETVATKPSDRKRTKIGVGEQVKLTVKPAGLTPIKWSVTGDGKLSAKTGSSVTFTADDKKSKPKVTASYGTTTVDVEFDVIAPTGIEFARVKSLNSTYPAGVAASGMHCSIKFNPTDVSFLNIEFLEVAGPASNITGYFTNFTAANLYHNPNPSWLGVNADNMLAGRDHCAMQTGPNGTGGWPAWSDGGYDWDIPNKYRVKGASATGGYAFTNSTQSFTIDAAGTVTVSKVDDGTAATISRTP
ncbi:hypothetical protein OAS39_11125, partial [Pirellulales bacterium]|nr:hypothetical protein [Pirellulales bacterium]